MTIAQWFDENGIENLPILNICVCRAMKKMGLHCGRIRPFLERW